jgi:hypothetical protein
MAGERISMLTGLPRRRQRAARQAEADFDMRQHMAGAGEHRGVEQIVLGRGEGADQAGLAGAVGVGQHGAEPAPRPQTQRGGGRCADMGERAQGGEVPTADIGVVHHLE